MRRGRGKAPASLVRRETDDVVIRQSFEIISPVFGGGVYIDPERSFDKKPDPLTPIRSAAVRSHLRSWWRIAHAGTLGSVERLREQEAVVWGLASRPGAVSVAIEQNITIQPMQVFKAHQSQNGTWSARSLPGMDALAYGCFPLQFPSGGQVEQAGMLSRFQGSATLTLTFPKAHKRGVERALRCWLAFGGIGGRTRRGFGAVSPLGDVEPRKALADTREGTIPGVPGLDVLISYTPQRRKTGEQALTDALGKLKDFRQQPGFARKQGHPRPGRSFWPEPDEIRRLTGQHAHRHAPVHPVRKFPRAAFGMPIIYDIRGHGEPGSSTLTPVGAERLASPLIIRPFRTESGQYRALAVILRDPAGPPDVVLQNGNNSFPVHSTLTAVEARQPPLNGILQGEADPLRRFIHFFGR